MTERVKRIQVDPDATERECRKCDTVKPFDAFPLRSNRRPSSWCRECTNAYNREYVKTPEGAAKKKRAAAEYNARNPDYFLTRNYGLKPGEYDRMRADQHDRCAICGTPDAGGRRWHVDHDHITGKVRGLLCSACNLTLGKMQDDPARLRAAADYIERHR